MLIESRAPCRWEALCAWLGALVGLARSQTRAGASGMSAFLCMHRSLQNVFNLQGWRLLLVTEFLCLLQPTQLGSNKALRIQLLLLHWSSALFVYLAAYALAVWMLLSWYIVCVVATGCPCFQSLISCMRFLGLMLLVHEESVVPPHHCGKWVLL